MQLRVEQVNGFDPLMVEPIIVVLVALAATALIIVAVSTNDRRR